jgi:hypothetical protein
MSFFKRLLKDPAFWALIAFNIIVIVQYRNDKQYYTTVVWLFWMQSVIIGVCNFFDMLTLKNMDNTNVTINGRPARPGEGKGCFSFFFLFHYGMFHLVYLVFLFIDFKVIDADFSNLKWGFYALLLNALIQFVQNKTIYKEIPRSIIGLFFFPYLRIVPMHLAILLPKFMHWQPGVTFLVIKAIVDVVSYIFTSPLKRKEMPAEPGVSS